MVMRPELRSTLEAVGRVMVEAQDDWWIIASAAAALHGVHHPEVGDVDVLVSDRDLTSLCERLSLRPVEASPHPLFASRGLVCWAEPPLTVEWMAGFHVRSEGQWRAVEPSTREAFVFGGHEVFAPSAPELAALLRLIGRPKDLTRAEALLAGR